MTTQATPTPRTRPVLQRIFSAPPTAANEPINGNLPQNQLAHAIALRHIAAIRWDDATQQWYNKAGNIWQPMPHGGAGVKQTIKRELDIALAQRGYQWSLVPNIEKLMQVDMGVGEWTEDRHLLPMANGVLNLRTRTLEAYGERMFDWQLPYDFTPSATCPTVKRYLLTATKKDRSLIKLLLAWMYAVLTGRHDLQKYIEIVGSGGSGKSTFLDLCTALVGKENIYVTSLQRLEKSPFETANLKARRLVLITDSKFFGGEVATLKAITGSDPLPFEKKGIQAGSPFVYTGLVMIATNEPIQSSDYTSGLARRKIPIEFNYRVTDSDKSRYPQNGGVSEAMKTQMSGLLNWLLSLNESDVIRTINNPEGEALRTKIDTAINTNPILGWMNDEVVQCAAGEEHMIGNANDLPGAWMYASYAKWCERQRREPVTVTRFSGLVIDNAGTYGIETAKKHTNRGKKLAGLRLRSSADNRLPTLISRVLLTD